LISIDQQDANPLQGEIQKASGDSIVEILCRDLPLRDREDDTLRLHVIRRSLDLLAGIHHAFVDPLPDDEDASAQGKTWKEAPAFEDAKRRRVLHALLDLISLEGIYASLSQGVGFPLEQRVISVLPAGVVVKQPKTAAEPRPQDESRLHHILGVLSVILFDGRRGTQPVILERILMDIICGTAELAFNSPHFSQDVRDKYNKMFETVINKYGIPMNPNQA